MNKKIVDSLQMKTIKDFIMESYDKKPFSNINGIKVKYGTADDIINIIQNNEYVYGGKDSETKTSERVIIDLPGKFNNDAWKNSGRSMPKRTYGICIVFKKGSCKWYQHTKEDIKELRAIYYNRYEGTYSYASEDIKDTNIIPIQID